MKTKFIFALGLSLWAVGAQAQDGAQACAAEDLACFEKEREDAVEALLLANSSFIRSLGLENDDVIKAWAQGQQGWQKMNAFTCEAVGLLAESEIAEVQCRTQGAVERTTLIEELTKLKR